MGVKLRQGAGPIEHKTVPFDVKAEHVDLDARTFQGTAAGIGNRDGGDDIIRPGAFANTIRERVPTGRVKWLDHHNVQTVGNLLGRVIEAEEQELSAEQRQGLVDRLGLDPDNLPTHRLWTKILGSSRDQVTSVLLDIRDRFLDALSIGFRAIRVLFESDDPDKNEDPRFAWLMGRGVRFIEEAALWEVSSVIWGMNPAAEIEPNAAMIKTLKEVADDVLAGRASVDSDDVIAVIKSLKRLVGDESDVLSEAIRENDALAKAVLARLDELGERVSASWAADPVDLFTRTYEAYKERVEDADPSTFVAMVDSALNSGTMSEGGIFLLRPEPSGVKVTYEVDPTTKAVVPFQDLPLAARDRVWDRNAAVQRVREWAGAEEAPNEDFRKAFVWWDPPGENFGDYKLPIADVIDGTLTAIPRGIFGAAGALQGSRGGVDIPESDVPRVRNHLSRYYRKMREEFDDENIIPPWERQSADPVLEALEVGIDMDGKRSIPMCGKDCEHVAGFGTDHPGSGLCVECETGKSDDLRARVSESLAPVLRLLGLEVVDSEEEGEVSTDEEVAEGAHAGHFDERPETADETLGEAVNFEQEEQMLEILALEFAFMREE